MRNYIASVMLAGLMAPGVLAGPTVHVKSDEDVLGNKISYPAGQAEITGLTAVQKPGECNGWHSHPVPTFGLVQKGELTVSYEGGETKVFHAGEMLIEAQHTAHEGCNTGEGDLEVLVFYAGAKGLANTDRREEERPE